MALRGRTHAIRIWRVGWWWVAGAGEGDTGGVKEKGKRDMEGGPSGQEVI